MTKRFKMILAVSAIAAAGIALTVTLTGGSRASTTPPTHVTHARAGTGSPRSATSTTTTSAPPTTTTTTAPPPVTAPPPPPTTTLPAPAMSHPPPPTPVPSSGIPQGNGGDHDADNNAGVDDHDGIV